MSKDLTKLSRKELESKLAKKYGVEKYLNQRSQLLSLLGMKGETDIETGFTGPETEALSIMFESNPSIGNRSKAEGGIVSLFTGSSDDDASGADSPAGEASQGAANEEGGEFSDTNAMDSMANTGDFGTFSGGGFDPKDDEDSGRGGDYTTDDEGQFSGYGFSYGKSIQDAVKGNPQLQGMLGKKISDLIDKGKVREFEFDKKGNITGVKASTKAPGLLGALLGNVTTYTGYGKGFDDMLGGGDDGDDTSEMVRKIVEEKKKEEDFPLTQEELDYYARGMGTATKPLKTLQDVNQYMSGLVGTTESPTGAKLSKDKKFLILPNGKIINLKTGKVQESMSGLELFRGGMI